jgi:hypothetical protein
MRNLIALLVFLLVLLCASCTSEALDAPLAQAAKSLNAQSKTSLGVGIRALPFLFDSEPGTFLLKDALVRDGSWSYLQDLERAGYVKANLVTSVEGQFVQIELTAKGRELQHALAGP